MHYKEGIVISTSHLVSGFEVRKHYMHGQLDHWLRIQKHVTVITFS